MSAPAGIQALLATYPRARRALPEPQRSLYLRELKANRGGGTRLLRTVNSLETWMHRRVAALRRPGEEILEIGAGTLNHLPYEEGAEAYDAIEPLDELWRTSPNVARLRAVYRSIEDLREDSIYDRILSIAVLEHLTDLPRIVALSAKRLRPGGTFQAAIPSEGGLLWGLAWRATTGLGYALRNRASYGAVMRHEHVNTAPEITAILKWFFADVQIAQFPAPWLHASFYRYLECRGPDLTRCDEYLNP